jgi:hypothetical protein
MASEHQYSDLRKVRMEDTLKKDAEKREQYKDLLDQLVEGKKFQYKEEINGKWINSEFIKFTESFSEPGTLVFFIDQNSGHQEYLFLNSD